MDSWLAPDIPVLPDSGVALTLYDTARRELVPTLTPGLSRPATLYVCGITPYDATHLGHAATMITFDIIQRVWKDAALTVRYVQNVTDIDEPLLERAERDGDDWIALGTREIALFRRDMEALRIIPPTRYVGAIESIPQIVSTVTTLLDKGYAYRMDDGSADVYFSLDTARAFGYESGLSRDEMMPLAARRGGDPGRPGKRDPLDPLLWRGVRPDEPFWDGGSLGPGRPGWHIECSVIALTELGESIDIQGGGKDLVFPHHECSAAHAEALTGVHPFAQHYVHTGMIGVNGKKMSKSTGNLVFVSQLRHEGIDPMAIRVALLADHYRTDRQWTPELLTTAQKRVGQWRRALAAPQGPEGMNLVSDMRARLADDLDTPGALAAVDVWASRALSGAGRDDHAPALVARAVDALLGVRL